MSDWWQSTSSTSFSTPTRGGAGAGGFHSSFSTNTNSSLGQGGQGLQGLGASQSRARFAGDELDPEDAKRADSIKFLPSFASSPAGKLALGTSPGTGSPPPARRSPTARFSLTPDTLGVSPRNARSSRAFPAAQNSIHDEDAPPTVSLRDETSGTNSLTPFGPSASTHAALALPSPPSLVAAPDTTTLLVFGPPVEALPALKSWLEEAGPVSAYRPGPEGTNWWIVEYASPTAASYALRRHGDVVGGRWIVGFKVVSSADASAIPRNAGTPIPVQNADILKPKPLVANKSSDAYAWDEAEQSNGIINKAAEWLFGR